MQKNGDSLRNVNEKQSELKIQRTKKIEDAIEKKSGLCRFLGRDKQVSKQCTKIQGLKMSHKPACKMLKKFVL